MQLKEFNHVHATKLNKLIKWYFWEIFLCSILFLLYVRLWMVIFNDLAWLWAHCSSKKVSCVLRLVAYCHVRVCVVVCVWEMLLLDALIYSQIYLIITNHPVANKVCLFRKVHIFLHSFSLNIPYNLKDCNKSW